MDRQRAIAAALGRAGPAPTYLEIGLATGTTFRGVIARTKLGVDPRPDSRSLRARSVASRWRARLPGRPYELVFRTTSDEFFRSQARLLRAHPPDVVLVDGLHTHDQTRRDIEHAVDVLAPGGVVIAHDCNPQSAAEAAPAPETLRWNGECWKAIVELRASRPDLDVCVLDCDEGLGIVRRRPATNPLELRTDGIASMSYAELDADRVHLLDLRPPEALASLLDAASP